MSEENPLLQIRVHLTNGNILKFGQDDPKQVTSLFDNMPSPDRLFAQPNVLIGGDQSFSAFRSSAVLRIDFVGSKVPKWAFQQQAENVQEISPELFQQRFDPQAYGAARRSAWANPGEKQFGFTELETITGLNYYWEVIMNSRSMTNLDIVPTIQSLVNATGLHAHLEEPGVAIVNPHNIVRFTFYPGPPTIPQKAWYAYRMAG